MPAIPSKPFSSDSSNPSVLPPRPNQSQAFDQKTPLPPRPGGKPPLPPRRHQSSRPLSLEDIYSTNHAATIKKAEDRISHLKQEMPINLQGICSLTEGLYKSISGTIDNREHIEFKDYLLSNDFGEVNSEEKNKLIEVLQLIFLVKERRAARTPPPSA